MMEMSPTRWYDLGPSRILQHPLATNPYWSTFWIYRGDVLLGKLLSVPSLADCEHVERWGDKYADQSWQPRSTLRGVAIPRRTATT